MAWCRQAPSHYLSQCWPRYLLPYGIIRPQWVSHMTLKIWAAKHCLNQWWHFVDGTLRNKFQSNWNKIMEIFFGKIIWKCCLQNGCLGLNISNNYRTCKGTVETLYSTICYSKYFIELNFDKSTQYAALWTHKRHPIPRPFGRAMECLLWVLQQKLTVL